MRLTRHANNRVRLYGLRHEDIPGAIVHLHAGRPVAIDVLGPTQDVDGPLQDVAVRHGLDLAALRAAAHSALAAPDRVVVLDVRARRRP